LLAGERVHAQGEIEERTASALVFPAQPGYLSPVRRLYTTLILALLLTGYVVQAAGGRVIKVLPLMIDHKGRHMLSPSLYERDAYQDLLRRNPALRSGMKFAVQWKVKGKPSAPLLLRVELRGVAQGNLPRQKTLEKLVTPGRWFTTWTELSLVGDEYADFGEVTAWRVTLWQKGPWDEQLLAGEQKSFLW
jgi:hypothetical protein